MERGGGNEKKDDDSPVPTTNRPSVVREREELENYLRSLISSSSLAVGYQLTPVDPKSTLHV